MPETSTAVATTTDATGRQVVRVPLNQPLADMDQAWRLAVAFANADIVPTSLRGKPANVFLTMLYGQRLGLPPEIAINEIAVVKGKPRMSGQLLLAKVREAGHRAFVPCTECGQAKVDHSDNKLAHNYVADHDSQHCTFTIIRSDGEEHTETYTIEDAVTARLCTIKDGKPFARSKQGEAMTWETNPKRMLRWRAVGAGVDIICPEVKMGFAVEGELDELPQDMPTLGQVAAERMDKASEPAAPVVDEDAELRAQIDQIAQDHATPADAVESEPEADLAAYEETDGALFGGEQ
jgi:hypothetical protein